MPLSSELVGVTGATAITDVEARWTMAYAAALGATSPDFLATSVRADVLAHPLFPVCFEWPVFLDLGRLLEEKGMPAAERVRGVHFTHQLDLQRPLRAGERLRTRARIVAVERHRAGAYQQVQLDTTDDSGVLVCTTGYGSLYRGVEVVGPDRREGAQPERLPPGGTELRALRVPVAANAAHVYTECARIWNPIHTDEAVARRAGLPGLILHGTATLAMAVTALVNAEWAGAFDRVGSLRGRFGAMVALPSTLEVRVLDASDDAIRFEVRNADDEPAVRDGLLTALRDELT